MMVGRWVSIPLMAVVLAVATPASADQWYEHYARAEAALAAEDHETAIDELTLALERRGDSGARVRTYGMRVTAYFPYLKLGIAYFLAGEHEAALRAFDTEQRVGAIAGSEEALAELERYRRLASDALEALRDDRRRATDEIVAQSLAEARDLERRGRLDEALAVVARALSLAPEDPESNALATALREEVSRQSEDRARQQRASQLIEDGARLRSEGQLAEAAARFRQAVALEPGGDAAALLDEVQVELARRVEALPSPDTDGLLERAGELLEAGELEAALGLVQEVAAARPESPEAAELDRQILAQIADEERLTRIRQLLSDGEVALAARDPEGAIAAANLVLARDQGHPEALDLTRRAYAELSRRLLGDRSQQNLPPAIRFADLRVEGPDGLLVQVVRDPDVRVSGVVIDDSEIAVSAVDGAGSPLAIELSSQLVGGVHIAEFRIGAVLPAGLTTVHVVATDRDGQSSRSEYAVEYRRPLVRSPWLWGALLGVPLAAAAVVALRRLLERRQLLRRRFNPFIAGPPVLDPDLFFGRDEVLDRVAATVPNNSLLLLGERRIGKTSLLHQLHLRLRELDHPSFHFVPIYIDLQGTSEPAFFATVAEAIGEAIDDPPMAASRAGGGYGSGDLVRDLRRVLPTVDCPDGKRVKLVLLLDEIDELNAYSHRTNQRLRSLFMRGFADQLVAVAAGVGIARGWEHEGSPWYNFFEELEIGPIAAAAARQLVTRPLHGVITIDDGAAERLLHEAAGRPYVLQKVALAVVQRLHESGRRRIGIADVEAVLRRDDASEGEDGGQRRDRGSL